MRSRGDNGVVLVQQPRDDCITRAAERWRLRRAGRTHDTSANAGVGNVLQDPAHARAHATTDAVANAGAHAADVVPDACALACANQRADAGAADAGAHAV